jgi:type I restriction enzyme S subunit
MSVPALRFRDRNGAEFPIWQIKALGSIADVTKLAGYEFTKHILYADTGNIIALRGLNVKGNKLDLSDVKYIDKSDFSKLSRSKLIIDDLLFTYVGTIGEVALIFENDRFYLAPNVARIRVDANLLLPKFALQYFNNSDFKEKQINLYIATSSQPALSMENIRKFEINLPSLEEQTKIANFLTAVDEKITQLTQKYDLLTQYKKGVMQQIFSQELRFKDDDGRDFPEWEGKILDDVALSISNGLSLDQSLERSGYMVTRIETISDKKINLEKVGYIQTDLDISMYKLDVGDILFSNINSISHIGKVVFVDKDYQLYHGMNLLRIVINQTTNNSKFVFYQLSSEKMKQNFETKANKAVNQASINQTELKKTELTIPSLPEQIKITNFLTAIDDKITITKAQLDAVKQYKQGLLQQMFV